MLAAVSEWQAEVFGLRHLDNLPMGEISQRTSSDPRTRAIQPAHRELNRRRVRRRRSAWRLRDEPTEHLDPITGRSQRDASWVNRSMSAKLEGRPGRRCDGFHDGRASRISRGGQARRPCGSCVQGAPAPQAVVDRTLARQTRGGRRRGAPAARAPSVPPEESSRRGCCPPMRSRSPHSPWRGLRSRLSRSEPRSWRSARRCASGAPVTSSRTIAPSVAAPTPTCVIPCTPARSAWASALPPSRAVARSRWCSACFPPFFFLYYLPYKDRIESARLERRYGPDYARLPRAVPALLPALAPSRRPAPRGPRSAGVRNGFATTTSRGRCWGSGVALVLLALRPVLATDAAAGAPGSRART